MTVSLAGVCYTVHRVVMGDTHFVMKNLHHFSRYSIKVIACRELDPSEMKSPELAQNCSPAAIIQQRTLHKGRELLGLHVNIYCSLFVPISVDLTGTFLCALQHLQTQF